MQQMSSPSNKQIYTLHLWCAQDLSTTYGRKTKRIAGIQRVKKQKKITRSTCSKQLKLISFFMPFHHLFEKHCTPLVCDGQSHYQPTTFLLFSETPTQLKSTNRQATQGLPATAPKFHPH
jgi:hypothetical protein